MIKKLWKRFVKNWIVDRDPGDEGIADLHTAITYIWSCIDNAEFHHEFFIVSREIEMFRDKYQNRGYDDFEDVVKGMEEHLSDRIDKVQSLSTV